MRVREGAGCATANFVADAPSPNAAIPPARKFRRALFCGFAAVVQQAHERKRLYHAGLCNIVDVGKNSAFIPALTFYFFITLTKLIRVRAYGKRARATLLRKIALSQRRPRQSLKGFLAESP